MIRLTDLELRHYGVKGQKWGIRRYHNADGTLTAEGKARYYGKNGELSEEGKSARKAYADAYKSEVVDLQSKMSKGAYSKFNKAIMEYRDRLIESKYSSDAFLMSYVKKIGREPTDDEYEQLANAFKKTDVHKKYVKAEKELATATREAVAEIAGRDIFDEKVSELISSSSAYDYSSLGESYASTISNFYTQHVRDMVLDMF